MAFSGFLAVEYNRLQWSSAALDIGFIMGIIKILIHKSRKRLMNGILRFSLLGRLLNLKVAIYLFQSLFDDAMETQNFILKS